MGVFACASVCRLIINSSQVNPNFDGIYCLLVNPVAISRGNSNLQKYFVKQASSNSSYCMSRPIGMTNGPLLAKKSIQLTVKVDQSAYGMS